MIDFNQEAMKQLTCKKALRVVPEAGHLFEEPGKLEDVAQMSREWFEHYLAVRHQPDSSIPDRDRGIA